MAALTNANLLTHMRRVYEAEPNQALSPSLIRVIFARPARIKPTRLTLPSPSTTWP